MKLKHTLAPALALLILVSGCGNIPRVTEPIAATHPQQVTAPSRGSATEQESPSTIGTVSNIRTQVYVGAPDNLALVEGKRDLGNDDYVQVQDGGKARLEFPGPINLLLYNQSEMDNIKLEYESNSNPRIVNRLIRGGFSGSVEPGNQLTIDLAFGVQVNVLGTHFFVLYDEESGYITVGKFDGTLSLSVPGQPVVYLDDLEMIDVNSDGTLTRYSNISFTVADFDTGADSCVSPIQGINILRRDHNLPQPGQETVQEADAKLACEPVIPNTAACLQPTASVSVRHVQLREGPDLRFISMGDYQANDQFVISGHYQGWYKGKFADGKTGWLYKDWISIPPEVDIDSICSILYRDLPPTPTRHPTCRPSKYVKCP